MQYSVVDEGSSAMALRHVTWTRDAFCTWACLIGTSFACIMHACSLSREQLRAVCAAEKPRRSLGPLTFDHVCADIRDLHMDPVNKGSVFQVASQVCGAVAVAVAVTFVVAHEGRVDGIPYYTDELLGNATPDVTPAHGITGYVRDRTQVRARVFLRERVPVLRFVVLPFFAGPGLCLDVSGSDIVPKLLSPTRQHFGRGGSNRAKRSPQVLDGAQWVLLAGKGRAYGCPGTAPAHRSITAVPSQGRAEDWRPLVIMTQ